MANGSSHRRGGSRCLGCQDVALLPDDDPVRTLLGVGVESFAIVTPYAFRRDDFRPSNGSPLARLLTDFAGVALGPSLDAEDGQIREQPEKGADRTQEPAVEIPDE